MVSISATGFGKKITKSDTKSRADNCLLTPKLTDRINRKWKIVQRYFRKKKEENKFGKALKHIYHSEGHLAIGETCKNKPDDFDSAMVFSEVSARDPIFYRC